MAWVIGIGILIFLCIKFPNFRKFTIGIAILIVLVIAWFIFSSQHNEEVAKTLISKDQIEINNLRLGQQYSSSYQLTGEAKNNSSHELTGITFTVKAFDCPSNVITSDCTVIGQDNNVYVYIDIPSNQVRQIDSAYVSLSNMPQVKGQFLWSYEISGITGK
jgi:hypothetical protein